MRSHEGPGGARVVGTDLANRSDRSKLGRPGPTRAIGAIGADWGDQANQAGAITAIAVSLADWCQASAIGAISADRGNSSQAGPSRLIGAIRAIEESGPTRGIRSDRC